MEGNNRPIAVHWDSSGVDEEVREEIKETLQQEVGEPHLTANDSVEQAIDPSQLTWIIDASAELSKIALGIAIERFIEAKLGSTDDATVEVDVVGGWTEREGDTIVFNQIGGKTEVNLDGETQEVQIGGETVEVPVVSEE